MKEYIRYEGELFDSFEEVEVPNPDTGLHCVSGPTPLTPRWVLESWNKAAIARRQAETTTLIVPDELS